MQDRIEKSLRQFFRTKSARAEERRRDCLDEAQVAAYVDRNLVGPEKTRLEAHLADCEFCLGQVVFLARLRETPIPEPLPAALLARARELAAPKARPWTAWVWRWEAVAAMAACAVVVTVVSLREAPRQAPFVSPVPHGEAVAPRVQAPREVKPLAPVAPAPAPTTVPLGAGVRGLSTPALIFPAPHATLPRPQVEFRWQTVAGALDYEVRLVTAEGDLVWEQRTEANSVKLPAGVSLVAGQKYFVWVRANLGEGKTSQSRAVAFTVADHN